MNERSILRGPLGASLAALSVIVLFTIIMAPGLYRSAFTVFSGGTNESGSLDQFIAAHERNMDTDVDRFNGRSFFYLPRPKPKPRPVVPPPPPPPPSPEPEDKPDPVPTYPANYTGPKLIAILGDEAWFRKESSNFDPTTRIRIGEILHGIELLSTDAPRGIRVKYQDGGPYDVALINMSVDPFADPATHSMPRGVLEEVEEDTHGDDAHHEEPSPAEIEGVNIPISETTEPVDPPTPAAPPTEAPADETDTTDPEEGDAPPSPSADDLDLPPAPDVDEEH